MELPPEEKRRIYEEEKARLESEENLKPESNPHGAGTTGMEPNVAGLLCYVGFWISGIIVLVLEQKNKFVRYHAAQSIVVFSTLMLLSGVLGFVPFAGPFFSAAIGVLIFILWMVLMVKAYQGELYRLPVAAELAEGLLNAIGPAVNRQADEKQRSEQGVTMKESQRERHPRAGEIVASTLAIAFNLTALIFLNFFHDYIAYYYQSGGVWVREPLLTSSYSDWLPVVSVAIILTIIGHIMLIMTGQRLIREAVLLILDIFALIAMGSLLSIFPFDFRPLPISTLPVEWAVRLGLGIAILGISVAVIIRLVRLVLRIVKG